MKSYVIFSTVVALATSIGFISGSFFEKYNQKEALLAYSLKLQMNFNVLNYYLTVKTSAMAVEDLSSVTSEEGIKIIEKKWINRLRSDVGVFQSAFLESKQVGINTPVFNMFKDEVEKLDEQYNLEVMSRN